MPPEHTCQGTKDDGSPCETPEGFVGDDGWCASHRPGDREKLREWASKGGRASAEKRKRDGLEDADLPPLTSAQAAEVWCDTVGRACVTGRIGHHEAKAALKAVREWRESHEAGAVSEKLEELDRAISEWRKTGSPEAVLKLVE